jgi:hypothetical protein
MKKSIKIVKRGRRALSDGAQQVSTVTAKTENQVRREIAQKVTSWIEERRTGESVQRRSSNLLVSDGA